MANASVDDKPVWYPLSAHDDNSSPLGPPTPAQSPSGVGSRTNGNAGESVFNCKKIVCMLFCSSQCRSVNRNRTIIRIYCLTRSDGNG